VLEKRSDGHGPSGGDEFVPVLKSYDQRSSGAGHPPERRSKRQQAFNRGSDRRI
jgi:hypothetical protein